MLKHIDLLELKLLTGKLIDHIVSSSGVTIVTIDDDKDFYWDLSWDELYDTTCTPPQLDVGRLSDDLEFLKNTALQDHKAALCLRNAAALLRYISKKVAV
jgi:hypothetical protein